MKGEEEKEGGEERGAASSEEKFVLTIPPFHPSPSSPAAPHHPASDPPREGKSRGGEPRRAVPPLPFLRREKEMIFRKKTSLRSFLHSSPPSPRRYVGSRASGRGERAARGTAGGRGVPAADPLGGPGPWRRRGAGAGAARPPPPLFASPEPVL